MARWAMMLMGFGMLLGCYPKGDPTAPIPQQMHAAPAGPATRLVVVLPGRGDGFDGLRRTGIDRVIQREWPDADVVLTGLTLGYYLEGHAIERLHAEVLQPARARGYRQIWLLGVSLGGAGALLYDDAHPDVATGLLLLAPYLGEAGLHREITEAGGLAKWNPGPEPAGALDGSGFQRKLWRVLQARSRQPAGRSSLWIGYGENDRLRGSLPVLGSQLPPDHLVLRPGGHDWATWMPMARDLLEAASSPAPSP